MTHDSTIVNNSEEYPRAPPGTIHLSVRDLVEFSLVVYLPEKVKGVSGTFYISVREQILLEKFQQIALAKKPLMQDS